MLASKQLNSASFILGTMHGLLELYDLLFHKAQKPGCCNLRATTGLLCHHQKPATSPLAQAPPPDVLASLLPNLT